MVCCDNLKAYTFIHNDTEISRNGIYKYDCNAENTLKILPKDSEKKPAAIDIWEGNSVTSNNTEAYIVK